MFASIGHYDTGGSFLGVGMVLVVLTLAITGVESIVMLLLRWGRFGRCLWAAFLMNVVSTFFGSVLVAYLGWASAYVWLPVTFALSVLIEGGVLMLMKRGAARQNWKVSLVANLVSYLLIIVPCAIWPEILDSIATPFL